MGKLPDRWLPYSSVGRPIEGTKFIAFKVPLKEAICRNLKPDEWFTPSMLVEQCPHLSLVVDLTNTRRYYNPQEFLSKGILYKKILCPGKVIPGDDKVQRFISIVDEYVSQNGDSKESLIGVHCTHGLNRTAYFICNYMIKRLRIPATEAISAFEHARGHSIERKEYIKALMNIGDSDTRKREAQYESPLGSLYADPPIRNKYPISRQMYHPRRGPECFSSTLNHTWNHLSNDRSHSYLQRPTPCIHHNSQQNGYGNHLERRQFVRNDRRYVKDSEHSQFVGNNGRNANLLSLYGPPPESQAHHPSGNHKRWRDRDPEYDTRDCSQQHKGKYSENPRFVRLGEGLAASSSTENQLHPAKYRTNKCQKDRQNSLSSRQPQVHSEHESPFQDPPRPRNDFKPS